MTTAIERSVDFHGDSLVVIQQDGIDHTPIKPLCDILGIDWEGQRQRIERDEVLREGACILQAPSAGGPQQMLCLPLDYLNGWMFGVQVSQIRPELRAKLILYKRECYRALALAFRGAGAGAAPLARVAALEDRVAALEAAQRGTQALAYLSEDQKQQILALLEVTHNPTDRLTTAEIAEHLAARGVALGTSLRGQQMIIAALLRRAGVGRVVRRRAAGSSARAWVGVKVAG